MGPFLDSPEDLVAPPLTVGAALVPAFFSSGFADAFLASASGLTMVGFLAVADEVAVGAGAGFVAAAEAATTLGSPLNLIIILSRIFFVQK